MFVINKAQNNIEKITECSFSELGFKEKEHLQEWLAGNPEAFDEELLIIQKEFDGFDDTKERLDLLALDKQGNLVVIENKLDDSGRDVTWQALKYTSYCSSLSKNQIKDIYQQYLQKYGQPQEDSVANITEFLEKEDFEEVQLNQDQRIVLVAGNYRKEVTSTVLWLLTKYKLKIQCFKATPYTFQEQTFLQMEQIIPVKEAEEYTIKMAEKAQEDQQTQDELKTRHKVRLEFWRKLLDHFNQSIQTALFQNVSPSKESWISAGSGMSGVVFAFGASRSCARVELRMERSNAKENKYIFEELYQQKESLEAAFGSPLKWEKTDTKKSSRVKIENYNLSLYRKEDWDAMIQFMTEKMLQLEKVFKKPLAEVNQKLKEISNGH
ncbi:MAG TPA: hypothetical protein DCS93_01905 [Microscillaceae bacterium]|nr:hypothetical protein [Microscillaceae bacterium]